MCVQETPLQTVVLSTPSFARVGTRLSSRQFKTFEYFELSHETIFARPMSADSCTHKANGEVSRKIPESVRGASPHRGN